MANEIVPSDLIEGEFTVEEASGFSCRNCGIELIVGAMSCKCGRQFSIATPNIKNVPAGYSPARAKVMTVIYRDRVSTSEVENARNSWPVVKNPHYTAP